MTKLEKSILDIGLENLRINLKDVLTQIKWVCNDLILSDVVAPFLDTIESARLRDKHVIRGYINKLHDFAALLDKSEMFFKDLRNMSLISLYEAHCAHERYSIMIYEQEIRKRSKLGILPTSEDLQYFSDPTVFDRAKESDWRFPLINFILRSNYIFY